MDRKHEKVEIRLLSFKPNFDLLTCEHLDISGSNREGWRAGTRRHVLMTEEGILFALNSLERQLLDTVHVHALLSKTRAR